MFKFRSLALALLLALSLVSAVAAQDKTVIQLWTGSSSPVENAALEAQIAAFEEANPTIDVDLLISPDYGTQLQTAFASGDYPDVFAVGQFEFPSYQDSGVLMPADGRIEAQDDIYPSLLAAFTAEDGTVYCPPKDFSTLALLYNKDLFDAAGVEYPNGDSTWEDIYAAAEAINSADVSGMSVAPDRNRWMGFLYGNGGNLFDADGNVVINSPEAVASLDYYSSFVGNGIGKTPADLESGWNGEAFGRGLAAMTIEGNWAIGFLDESYPDLNWGVAELPTGPSGEKGTLTFTVCWAVGANTPYPEESWALVNFLTGPEGAQTVATSGFGVMPARESAGAAWLETKGEEFAPFVDGAEYAVAPVFPLGYADFTTILDNGMNEVLSGTTTAQDLLDEAAEVAQEIKDELS